MSELLNLMLHAWLLSAGAVVFGYVLVQDGMLLAPVQAWVRACWRAWGIRVIKRAMIERHGAALHEAVHPFIEANPDEIDARWWWKPLWGCSLCVAGQWAFWGYLLSCLHLKPLSFIGYDPLHHLYFTSLAILFAAGWRAFYAICQTK